MDLKKAILLLGKISRDKRVSIWHFGVYVAILQLWHKGNHVNPIAITRRRIMQLAHVSSIATYHKCIRELDRYGYIKYEPSYHPCGSKVFLEIEAEA